LPETAWLDDLDLGPSMRTAIDAGKALAQLRQERDPGPAAALPWASHHLLRVHVPPSMLCELALAAGDSVPLAAATLSRIPGSFRWIHRLVDHPETSTRVAARRAVAGVPVRPGYELEVTTFGELSIRRTDGEVVSDRVRGGRVQQLLARLLVDEAPLRAAIGERLWPELGDKQAATNLRVTLGSLLDLIEPDRLKGTSWFVRSDDGRLRLTDDGISIDVRRFEERVAAARDAERLSKLTLALDHHREAFRIYRGEFMPGVLDPDVEHERLRLQSLAYASGCRLGELLLAKGEPEEALRAVVDAARIDPLAERAGRTEIRCHLALGSATAARTAARHLREMLVREGLTPERETELLLAKVDA
jgi:DNA-binding SARP family transcriptional activator